VRARKSVFSRDVPACSGFCAGVFPRLAVLLRFLCLPAPAKFEFLAEKIGLAFAVTDANGEADQKAYLWAAGAQNIPPKTWGIAVVERKRGRITRAD
jgi:hypothetical protein